MPGAVRCAVRISRAWACVPANSEPRELAWSAPLSMNFASTRFYHAAKTAYIFNSLAGASLRRTTTKFVRGRPEKPSVKVVSYFGW
jgi:hypothetical protein